jgi:co-chaperonin GroES (HSP10)
MIRSLFDYVFIEVEGSLFNEDSGIKGHDGTNIQIDPSYDPQVHIKICGKVVSIPEEMTKRPIHQETKGTPSYTFDRNFQYKTRSDIEQEVQIGDTIYFHFNTLASENGEKNRVRDNIFKVAYENIICAVRDFEGDGADEEEELKEIQMIGGYCLIRPDVESWDETLIPVPQMINGEVMKDKHGQPVMKDKKDWIVAKMAPEVRYLQGFVVNAGSPLKGDSKDIKQGDKIWYRHNADWRQKIEGQEYFAIRQRHILMKLDAELL